jgi:hypothetical protein
MRKILLLGVLALSGCYQGKMSHPIDCAMGLTFWQGYCPVPGTPGYAKEQAIAPIPEHWQMPPNKPAALFAKDRYECMQEGRSNFSAGGSVAGAGANRKFGIGLGIGSEYSGETVNRSLMIACMQARGYESAE